ncbi:MAG: WbuC family cupin fold metalloprotein [Bacteroidales bacterium]|nr:WbuC family cupin fold metalloprotein [Bacteroidales bacterium]MBN2819411.1 WbuC family cupin fold metalloprotein [Bacteroidales bacterium]
MKKINKPLLDSVSEQAKKTERLRMNYNFHEELSDKLQRLLNAVEPGTYVQPHKHENPDKREIFTVLKGKILVITFNDSGKITEHIVLDPLAGNYGVEIAAGVWHTLLSLESGTVVFEVKDGPYSPIDDKNFAQWAPAEGDNGCQEYIIKLFKETGVKQPG